LINDVEEAVEYDHQKIT